jgi:NAD-dependent SIR2 family protein deacetylase/ankyrin repeat protein
MGGHLSRLTKTTKTIYFSFLWKVFDHAFSRKNKYLLNFTYYFGMNHLPKDSFDQTNPLIRSSLCADEESVDFLLSTYQHQINETAQGGQASIHAIATNGNTKICLKLLKHGANINLQTDRKHTPLMIACSLGHIDIVKLLLLHNANPMLCDIDNKTCLHYSIKSYEITKLLINETKGELLVSRDVNGKAPFIVAVMLQSNSEIIQLMIDSFQKYSNLYKNNIEHLMNQNIINIQSNDGMTALLHACHRGMFDTVKQLLNAEGNTKLRDAYGQTCLHLAAKSREYKIIKLLLENDKEKHKHRNEKEDKEEENKLEEDNEEELWNMKDDDGLEAIHAVISGLFASKNEQEGLNSYKSLEVFLEEYPQAVHEVDFSDTSALHLIIQCHFNKSKTSNNKKNNKNNNDGNNNDEVDDDEETYLDICVTKMIVLLLKNGADVILEDESGWNSLHYMYNFISQSSSSSSSYSNSENEDIHPKFHPIETTNITGGINKYSNKILNILEKSISNIETINSIDKNKLQIKKTKYLLKRGAYHRIPIKDRDEVLRGEQSLKGIAQRLLRNDINNKQTQKHKIVILCGAGISTSAGIPDYRSNTGIYKTKAGRDAFSSFYENPNYFWNFARKTFGPIISGNIKPTPCHKFFNHLNKLNYLQRIYTQNVDGLEHRSGIPSDKIVQCHGSIDKIICSQCSSQKSVITDKDTISSIYNPTPTTSSSSSSFDKKQQKKIDNKDIKNGDDNEDDMEYDLPICSECSSALRPAVTFFGEPLSPSFLATQDEDFKECSLLIVLGTTLQVYPFAGLLNKTSLLTPRLLINKELTGPFKQLNDGNHKYRDAYIGNVDDGVKELAQMLGLEESEWLN